MIEIAVCSMYLNPVEASADGIVGRRDILLCRVFDLVDDESMRDPTVILERNSPGAEQPWSSRP
jgi:hypothetical protein